MQENPGWTDTGPPAFVHRKTLCLARPEPSLVVHGGDVGFREDVLKLCSVHESNAAEQLVALKSQLQHAAGDEFWSLVTQGLAAIAGAQYAFVSKRVLVDAENAAVEMPPIGETGACLMATAIYFNDGAGTKTHFPKNFKYHAYGCPCAYMRHDKVFIIPERLNDFITDNPNQMPTPGEAYFGIPLYAQGKCFAHFGVMWSADGAANRKLGWGYLEMLLHSLEDMILYRILEGDSFKKPDLVERETSQVIPHSAITAVQSLKPYARSLSHELRTPMQGVVGMLDVMYATVQDAAESQTNPEVQQVFQTLKENIEVVQDSSRRAVEAADNVVHAYDLDMSVPDAAPSPLERDDLDEYPKLQSPYSGADDPTTAKSSLAGSKRKRDRDEPWAMGSATKLHASDPSTARRAPSNDVVKRAVTECNRIIDGEHYPHSISSGYDTGSKSPRPNLSASSSHEAEVSTSTFRHSALREVIQYVVMESLKVGGRPESTISRGTALGEIIEVQTKSSDGTVHAKRIEWTVESSVPDSIFIDEKDLAKLISCILLNAVKFTEEGEISVTAKMSPKGRYVVVNVKDTGPGIPAAFIPKLFQPFSREDDSLTRQQEGLGLGLLVAKGLARKLGGDLVCIRADTTGPNRGSQFEMRIPISPSEASRPPSPFPSPRLSGINRRPSDPGFRALAGQAANVLEQEPATVGDHLLHPPHPARPFHPQQQPIKTDNSPGIATPSPVYNSNTSAARRPTVNDTAPRPPNKPPSSKRASFNRNLALLHPLTFLVAEDNKINRALLVNMLLKLGYSATSIHEAHDGADAVRQMRRVQAAGGAIDVVLMDLWMPHMDGYEAAQRILVMHGVGKENEEQPPQKPPPLTSSESAGSEESNVTNEDVSPCCPPLLLSPPAEEGGSHAKAPPLSDGGRKKKAPTILAVTADVTEGALGRAATVGMRGYMTKPYKLLDLERLIVQYC